jgi:hypothetical protein
MSITIYPCQIQQTEIFSSRTDRLTLKGFVLETIDFPVYPGG